MTEAPIYMTDSYCGLSHLIYSLKYNEIMDKKRKEAILTAVITTVDTLSSLIAFRKVKAELSNDPDATEYMDQTMNNNLLETFFGNNELPEMELQLKGLTKKLRDTTAAVSFDWQRFFE